MRRVWCDRCNEEILMNSGYEIELPVIEKYLNDFNIPDKFEICKKCVITLKKVLKNECSIIVGEKS